MKNKYVFVFALLLVIAMAGFGFTKLCADSTGDEEKEDLRIVTSFYPMYIATLNVVGDCEHITVENLSEPQTGCLHDYQLTPQDMILLSEADVFVINGGGMETFLTEIAEKYPNLTIIDAGAEIFNKETHEHDEEQLHDKEHAQEAGHTHHHENAHAWMSMAHYAQQVKTICDGLIEADYANAELYRMATDSYLQKIKEVQQGAETLKEVADGKKVISLHEAFAFLAEDYEMKIAAEMNLDSDHQASAGEIAEIISLIKENQIEILLAEDLYGEELSATIEKETDCKVFYLNTLVRGEYEKDSWIAGMQENVHTLQKAFGIE